LFFALLARFLLRLGGSRLLCWCGFLLGFGRRGALLRGCGFRLFFVLLARFLFRLGGCGLLFWLRRWFRLRRRRFGFLFLFLAWLLFRLGGSLLGGAIFRAFTFRAVCLGQNQRQRLYVRHICESALKWSSA